MAGSEPDEGPDASAAPVELTIQSLAFGGEAIARAGGMVVLVDRAVPGDRILARITQRSRRFARAALLEVLSASPDRVPAPCVHYQACNGCSYQEAAPPLQREAKRRQVADLLSRIGKVESPRVSEILASSHDFHYRRRMSYTFPRQRSAGPGLHQRRSPERILEVPDCLLPEERVQKAYRLLLPELSALPPSDHPGRLELYAGDAGPPVAVLRAAGQPHPLLRRRAETWVEKEVLLGTVWIATTGRLRRRGGGEKITLAGQASIQSSLGRFRFNVPAGSFFQANPMLAAQVFERMAQKLPRSCEEVLELYAGVGALSLFLSGPGRRILAVEGDPDAVRAAEANATENGCGGIEWRNLDVRQALEGAIGNTFDAVVADPPRTGLPPGCAAKLAGLARRKILYLSCNPATMARDLAEIMAGGEWELKDALPADFFPHTAEIECLVELQRR
ncbi:MAG TPA: 23S rRNA (uracil(1939)-C(5))-methyltransferase RlmD [Candidatus Polarisedimenticolia bacterium]|nr:23S rRNA (uracil(1939)-C(5))-methyltransferase RlmD [Candidatus Polarisedimenticolia bacterium]